MFQNAEITQRNTRIHWTARAGFYLNFIVIMLPVAERWLSFLPTYPPAFLVSLNEDIPLFLPFPALIISVLALLIARRPQWRRGLEFTLLSLVMSILTCIYPLTYLILSCCVRMHIVL